MTPLKNECNLRTKLFWKDILIYKSKDIPWKIKCRRLVDRVYAVFACGSENWSMGDKRQWCVSIASKNNKKKFWSTIVQVLAKRLARYGYRWVCPFCVR